MKIYQILTKEKGRELIKKIPMEMVERISNNSISNTRPKFIVSIMNNSLKINVATPAAILTLFNDTCPICGKRFTHYIVTERDNLLTLRPVILKNGQIELFNIDHIIPKSKGGSNSVINCQITCAECNTKKSSQLTNNELKYGVYYQGIFKDINRIKKIILSKNRVLTNPDIKQVLGGLFYIQTNNFGEYFYPSGKQIENKYEVKSMEY